MSVTSHLFPWRSCITENMHLCHDPVEYIAQDVTPCVSLQMFFIAWQHLPNVSLKVASCSQKFNIK